MVNAMEAWTTHAISPVRPQSPRWLECVSQLDPKHGGMSVAIPQLASRLALENGFVIDIVALAARNETATLTDRPELKAHYWPASPKSWLLDRSFHRQLDALVEQADGIHIHGLWETHGAVCAAAARRHKRPYIISAHGMLEPWALAQKRVKKRIYASLIERRNLQHAACAHALTQAEMEDYRRFGYRGPIAVIPNGVDLPASVNRSLLPNIFTQLRYRRILLFLGRLHPKKGVDLLLKAWAALASTHADAVLVLAGPVTEEYRAQLQRLAEEINITDRVLFTGMLQGDLKWSALACAECFVLPSFSEGLSVAVLEALGMQVPVILTRQCHMPEIASSGAGWEIEPTVGDLASALNTVLGNSPAANAETGARGGSLAQHRFLWPAVAVQMARLYRWVAEGMVPENKPMEVCA